ncbi:MAG: hypothetical protein Q4D56_10860 [Bacteroides sp.]|nr:hypothetical protein [Bacteroides sp.]
MKKEHIGCLLLIGVIVLAAVIMYIGYALDISYLRNLCIMPPAIFPSLIGERYFAGKSGSQAKADCFRSSLVFSCSSSSH